jgi:hypothetical protein
LNTRRRFPLIVRLARIDRELDTAAQMLAVVGDDVLDTMATADDAGQRTLLMAGILAALLMGHGVDSRLVRTWLTEMDPGGDTLDADLQGAEIVQQIIVLFGPTQGEA